MNLYNLDQMRSLPSIIIFSQEIILCKKCEKCFYCLIQNIHFFRTFTIIENSNILSVAEMCTTNAKNFLCE